MHLPPSWQFVSVALGSPGAAHGVAVVQKWALPIGAALLGA